MTELICEECKKPIAPQVAIPVYDLFGVRYFHTYCISEEERHYDTPVHVQPPS